jgi:hypothetical protein
VPTGLPGHGLARVASYMIAQRVQELRAHRAFIRALVFAATRNKPRNGIMHAQLGVAAVPSGGYSLELNCWPLEMAASFYACPTFFNINECSYMDIAAIKTRCCRCASTVVGERCSPFRCAHLVFCACVERLRRRWLLTNGRRMRECRATTQFLLVHFGAISARSPRTLSVLLPSILWTISRKRTLAL